MRKQVSASIIAFVLVLSVFSVLTLWQTKLVYAATSFGYSTVGTFQTEYYDVYSGRFVGTNFTLTESANVTAIHVYMTQATYEQKSKVAIYANDFTKVAESLEYTRIEDGWFWYDFTFAANPILSAGQYFLCFWTGSSGLYAKYDSGDFTTQGIEGSGTYGTYPSTISTYNYTNAKYSIYANYTSAGATPPTFTVYAVNTTAASTNCLFSCLISDNVAVDFGIFGTNNTGHWVNETAVDISGTSAFVNVTKSLNDTEGNVVQYEWWGNDTENTWANSGIQSLTIGSTTKYLTINSLPVTVTYTINNTVLGASVNAASGSAADIQTAINSIVAAGGVGTVYIPAGTYNFYVYGQTWTDVYIPDGVNLIGAEPNAADSTIKVGVSRATLGVPSSWNTILNMPYEAGGGVDDPKVWFSMGNGSQSTSLSSRFANIKLQGYRTTNTASTSFSKGVVVYGVINFRIDHCMFENIPSGALTVPMWYQQNMYCSGVIDHCNITNLVGYDNLGNYHDSTVEYGIQVGRAYHPDAGFNLPMPYDQPMTMLGQYTNHTVFIENNYFSLWRHCVASGHSGYYVFRYNWINKDTAHYSLDVHGLRDAETGRSGGQGAEVYENNFTASVDWYGVMQDGGGYGVFFNNVIDSTYGFVTLYNEDAVYSSTWHLLNFFLWGNSGTWTPYITYPTGSIASERNVTADWTRPAGVYGGASYPNVSSSWSIASYVPYIYPMPLTQASLYSGYTNTTIELSPNTYLVTVPAQVVSGVYTYNFTEWQDSSTNNSIIINFSANTTLTATYTDITAVIVTIITPTNSTQASSSISISLSAVGGTISYYWYDCKNGTDWIYTTNQSWPGTATMTGFVNGTVYTLYAYANNTDGIEGMATVMFSVQILTDTGGTSQLIVNVWWSGWW
jgi:hypothetical protein